MTIKQMIGWMLAWGGITFGITVLFAVFGENAFTGDDGKKEFAGCWGLMWFVACLGVAANYLLQ